MDQVERKQAALRLLDVTEKIEKLEEEIAVRTVGTTARTGGSCLLKIAAGLFIFTGLGVIVIGFGLAGTVEAGPLAYLGLLGFGFVYFGIGYILWQVFGNRTDRYNENKHSELFALEKSLKQLQAEQRDLKAELM